MSARPPLALVSVYDPKKKASRWLTVQTEVAARGLLADTVVFVRMPTPDEFITLKECLAHAVTPQVYRLDRLLHLGMLDVASVGAAHRTPTFPELYPETIVTA